jgi:anhydro-N-acetylmuramic acid kinase
MGELFVGLISGTSMDGVDAALVELDDVRCGVRLTHTTPYPAALHSRLQRLVEAPQTTLRDLGTLDVAVGRFFAACTVALLERANVQPRDIVAIGHHGQTVYHHPRGTEPFSLQIGDPNVIAADTGITTVADFRRLDIALGGQGAPLVPAFHAWRFQEPAEARAVVNIGGIANVTLLDAARPALGFDTGPGNTLLDVWIRRCRNEPYDRAGAWAASGRVNNSLLESFLAEPFFVMPPPKSTGRELFSESWLDRRLATMQRPTDVDVQATLAELTATTIAAAVRGSLPNCARLIVCGGGAHNADLIARLGRQAALPVEASDGYGVGADWVEAAAFAWLARARVHERAGNVPSVTGARRPAVLGGVYWGAAP